jgi:hypothetical protein
MEACMKILVGWWLQGYGVIKILRSRKLQRWGQSLVSFAESWYSIGVALFKLNVRFQAMARPMEIRPLL